VAKVRVELNNPNLELKPEMYASGTLKSKMEQTDDLLIPRSSVLWTGKRAVVYVKVPNRKQTSFVYREIGLGPQAGNFYVVLDGLHEGEEIAINGVFKIDASAQLAGKPSMMNPTFTGVSSGRPEGGKASTGHNHGGTPMSDEEMEEMESTSIPDFSKVHPEFKKQLENLVKEYLELKNAFVATDEKLANATAQKTLDALNNVDMKLLSKDALNYWMDLQKPLKQNLNGIVNMNGIEMKRKHFNIVSDKMIAVLNVFGNPGDDPVYIEYCPMAFDFQGAFWISDEKAIRNPYFGDKMLTCGEVKKEF